MPNNLHVFVRINRKTTGKGNNMPKQSSGIPSKTMQHSFVTLLRFKCFADSKQFGIFLASVAQDIGFGKNPSSSVGENAESETLFIFWENDRITTIINKMDRRIIFLLPLII